MPQPQPNKPVWEQATPQDMVNILYVLTTIYNGCLTPVIRSGFGARAFAWYPASLILMIFYGGAAHCPEMQIYIGVWFMFIVMRRLTPNKRQHSRYQGYPWLCRLIPFVRNEYQARLLEPWVVFFGGIFLLDVSPGMAQFLIFGCISLFLTLLAEVSALSARKRAMEDARKEAKQMMDISQGGTGWGD
jgi:hypothetical protein